MLNVLAADIDDAGQYSCVATNRLGSCTTVGELNIQGDWFCDDNNNNNDNNNEWMNEWMNEWLLFQTTRSIEINIKH